MSTFPMFKAATGMGKILSVRGTGEVLIGGRVLVHPCLAMSRVQVHRAQKAGDAPGA